MVAMSYFMKSKKPLPPVAEALKEETEKKIEHIVLLSVEKVDQNPPSDFPI